HPPRQRPVRAPFRLALGPVRDAPGPARPARPHLRRRSAASGRAGPDAERRLVLHVVRRRLPRRAGPGTRADHLEQRLAHPADGDRPRGRRVPEARHPDRPDRGLHDRPDTFTSSSLGHRWEWNHNPDTSRFSTGDGLRLRTATVTGDLYAARNTLTHRIQGPQSTATIELDYSQMADGDRAGLAMLRDQSAWIGVKRDNGVSRVVMTNGLTMNSSWQTTGTGTEAASANISGGKLWLRVNADIRPGSGRQARFSYSTDGSTF